MSQGLYVMAAQQGLGAAELLLTGSNAGTRAAYDQAYNTSARKLAALNAKNASERNIAAIEQDKINSSLVIQQNQMQAEARVKVSAAAAGVEGGSIEDVKYETRKNAAHRDYNEKKKADQAIEGELVNIGNAQSNAAAQRERKISYVGELLSAFSAINMQDIQRAGAMFSGGADNSYGTFGRTAQMHSQGKGGY